MTAGVESPSRRRSARIEELTGVRSAEARRRLAIGLTLGVVVLAGVAGVVAWKLYVDAKSRALTDLRARTVAVGSVLDTAFAGDVSILQAVASAPAVTNGRTADVRTYLARAFANSKTFTGGVGWVGLDGKIRASTAHRTPRGVDLSKRLYVRRVFTTAKPFISGGLMGVRNRREIVVVAVPTFDEAGTLSGLMAGAILVTPKPESKQAVDLGFGDLEIIDRNGRMLLTDLGRVTNRALLVRMRKQGAGVVAGVRGLDGSSGHVVAFATVRQPHWLIAIDRPSGSIFGAARHALELQLGSIGAALAILLVLGLLLLRRTGRLGAAQDQRLHSWTRLTRRLASASTPGEVADVLLLTLADAFPESVAVVAITSGDRLRASARSHASRLARTASDPALLDAISRVAARGPRSWTVESEPALVPLNAAHSRLQAMHGIPIRDGSELLGTIAVVTPALTLDQNDWALLDSFADLGGQALERAWRFAHEHDLAVRLQRSLLPGELPEIEGLDLAAHYLAGAAAVEVGGDWNDAVRRPDGILQLCVGDVSGRGISAATIMGTQRNTFRAYAYECDSPSAIVQRMLRHVDGDGEMITVAAVTVDPYTGELRYARVGHPPPLLVDLGTGEVVRLGGAGAPPIGVAEPADIVEERVQLPDRALLAMYTDGLIERRGLNLEAAIDVFSGVLVDGAAVDPASLVARVGDRLGEPDDDVALLVVGFDAERTPFEVELPAEPSILAGLRRRLRRWLERRGIDDDGASEILLAVSEACNNAIEHAYGGALGTLTVAAETRSGWLEIVVEDHGRWRTTETSEDRGRGMLLIRRLMDSTEFQSDHLGTRAVLRRRLRSETAPAGEPLATPARS